MIFPFSSRVSTLSSSSGISLESLPWQNPKPVFRLKVLFLLCTSIFLSHQATASVVGKEGVYNACTTKEKWEHITLSEPWKSHFRSYLDNSMPAQIALAHAKKMRSAATSNFERHFSTYWLANALLRSQLLPVAGRGFSKLINTLSGKENFSSIQEASLACLLEVKRQYPATHLGASVDSTILSLDSSLLKDELLYTRALEKNRFKGWDQHFQQQAPYRFVYQALQHWAAQDWKEGAQKMNTLFSDPALSAQVQALQTTHANKWRVLAGRLNFAAGDYKAAERHYSMVDKRSNELVPSLTELAWTQLRKREHNAAIGTALSLQTGWLQNTYSPEGLMVMSMAFNETCHYPESMRSLSLLKEQYKPVADWIQLNRSMSGPKLYEELKLSLKKESTAPFRLSSEWVRSRKFLSRQTELNEGHRQASYQTAFEAEARKIQKQKIASLLEAIRIINQEVAQHQKEEPGKELPEVTAQRLEALRKGLNDYEDFKSISRMWQKVKSGNQALVQKRRAVLLKDIYAHIQNVNRNVLAQIQDINENLQFIEIEIYQGATQDMIFSNANPEFKKQLEDMKKKNKPKAKEGQMHWGSISTGSLSKSEIWEDELGGFKADLPNKCNKAQLAQGGI